MTDVKLSVIPPHFVGARMLAEVARVLDPSSGTYVCVTLAQPHVLGEPAIGCIIAACR